MLVAVGGMLSAQLLRAGSREGTVVGWGAIATPYVKPGTVYSHIAAGGNHSLALTSEGKVIAWGANTTSYSPAYTGQANPPAGLRNVVSIAGGIWHSLALKDNGTVVGWGLNNSGQSNIPAGLTN